jgi:hypothetical protein
MKRYPGDWIWAMWLTPFYLAASTATSIANAIAESLDRE